MKSTNIATRPGSTSSIVTVEVVDRFGREIERRVKVVHNTDAAIIEIDDAAHDQIAPSDEIVGTISIA